MKQTVQDQRDVLKVLIDTSVNYCKQFENGTPNLDEAAIVARHVRNGIQGVAVDLKHRLAVPRLNRIETA